MEGPYRVCERRRSRRVVLNMEVTPNIEILSVKLVTNGDHVTSNIHGRPQGGGTCPLDLEYIYIYIYI